MLAARHGILSALALTALLGCGADDEHEASVKPDVVLVIIDTLRQDHLSCYGHSRTTTPCLDQYAESSTLYRKATCQAPWTTPSIASMMTSLMPSTLGIHGERSAVAPEVEMLAETLNADGYITGAVVSHSFCSEDWGFGQGFDYFDDSHVLGHSAVTSEGVTDKAISFVEEFGDEDEPFFLWAHYFDPHCAYVEQEGFEFGGSGSYSGRVRSGQLFRKLLKMRDKLGAEDAEELLRLYDSEIAYTDHHLGRLLERLDPGALVVITSDHGEGFLDHGTLGHGKTLFHEAIDVPLIVHYPDSVGRVVDERVALLDIYPTVLDVVGIAPREGLLGRSIAPGRPMDANRLILSETDRVGAGSRAAIAGNYKLIVNPVSGKQDYYSLLDDPEEQSPIGRPDGLAGDRLEQAIDQFAQRAAVGRYRPRKVKVNEAEASRLQDMGYSGDDD